MSKPTADARHSAMKRRAKRGTIPAQGGKPAIHFKPGALHTQLGVPQGKKIPASLMAAARRGDKGPLAKRRALFARNVLKG